MKTIVELYNDDNRRPEVMERAGEILKKGGLELFRQKRCTDWVEML